MRLSVVGLLLLAACAGEDDSGAPAETGADSGGDSGTDSGDSGGDAEDTGGGDTTDTGTDDTADTDGGDTADTDGDADDDGFVAGEDCDDTDPDTYPGAPEWCDGRDTSCRGAHATDAGLVTWFPLHGPPEDHTATWAAGTERAPAAITLGDGTAAVCAGTWYVHLTAAGAEVTVRGVGSVEDVVLDGGGSGTVATLTPSDSATLEGLTLQGGAGMVGGGFVLSAATSRLADCVVRDNDAQGAGAGGTIWDGVAEVADTRFESNRAGGSGGGLFVYHATIDVRDVQFVDNVVDSRGEAGGGAMSWRGGTDDDARLDGITARGNRVTTERGIAYGGALLFEHDGTDPVSLSRVTLADNEAIGGTEAALGGGLAVVAPYSAALLTDVVLADNAATSPDVAWGGGAYVNVGGSGELLVIEGLAATGNRATGDESSKGGAVALSVRGGGATARMEGLELTDNAVESFGGGAATGTGGGLALDVAGSGLSVSIDDCALSGGSAHVAGGGEVEIEAGNVLSVTGLRAEGNTGDGLRLVAVDGGGEVELAESTLSENTGAGLSVGAEADAALVVTLPGDAHAHSALAGNATGLAVACGPSGGSCEVSSPWVDFTTASLSNLDCDVDVDGACSTELGDAAAIRCWSAPDGSGCE